MAPDQGANDTEVLQFAAENRMAILTSDRGMALACIERHQSVVWFDATKRGSKQLNRKEKRKLILKEYNKWIKLFAGSTGPMCVHVLSTRSYALSPEEALHLLQRRKRTRAVRERNLRTRPPSPPQETLPIDHNS